jgi:hypothetical protein
VGACPECWRPAFSHRLPEGTQHQLSISKHRAIVLYPLWAHFSFLGGLPEVAFITRLITSKLCWVVISNYLVFPTFSWSPSSASSTCLPILHPPSQFTGFFGCCSEHLLNQITQGLKEAHFRANNQLPLWIKLQTQIVPICLNNRRKMGPNCPILVCPPSLLI